MLPDRAHDTAPVLHDAPTAPAERGEHVFAVLANQARSRTTIELWTTAIGSGTTAVALWWQHPGLSWIAAAFTSIASYAVWGLIDRVDPERLELAASRAGAHDGVPAFVSRTFSVVSVAAVGCGTVTAVWTIFAFMRFMIGHWTF
jgi:hypothetical protein